jgi:molybdate transport system substrate-binding protein
MRKIIALVLVLLLAGATGCRVRRVSTSPSTTPKRTLSVYVPCGMVLPFNHAIKQFEKEQPGLKVKAEYDNAGILVSRIVERGERPDLFVSPGDREVGVLQEAGLIEEGTMRALGSFQVVLIVPRDNPAGVHSWQDLRKPTVKNIGVANPDSNSIGHYVRQGLRKMALWDAIRPKMILTDDAVDAYAMVSQSKVQAAFSYLTCPLQSNPEKLSKEKVRIADTLPEHLYDEARVIIAVLKTSQNKQLADQFTDYLLRPDVQNLLAEHGLPNERERAVGSTGERVPPDRAGAAP